MIVAGVICFLMGLVYYKFTQDTPEGNFSDLKSEGKLPVSKKADIKFTAVLKDYRVWILFLVYASCFGVELTVYGTMDDYLQNTFYLSRIDAGNIVLSFAMMNIFARTLGGFFGDKFGKSKGLKGRVVLLSLLLALEGAMLMFFSNINILAVAIAFLVAFSLTVQMAEGATFSVVPFINKKAIGFISGIVGAGGNVGAFLAAILLKSKSALAEKNAIASNQGSAQEIIDSAQATASSLAVADGYFLIGAIIIFSAAAALAIKFSSEDEKEVASEMNLIFELNSNKK